MMTINTNQIMTDIIEWVSLTFVKKPVSSVVLGTNIRTMCVLMQYSFSYIIHDDYIKRTVYVENDYLN